MRRVSTLAAFVLLAAGAAHAETWVGYTTVDPAKNIQWSYDKDYTYRDAQTKRVVVMTAVGKVGATPRMGPSGPEKPDGVGFVYAIDCKDANLITVGSYKPNQPLAVTEGWRSAAPKKMDGADNKALLDGVCAGADDLPVK